MADGSTIEWTNATWQIVTGCSLESPGCTRCYAMKLAGGRLRNHPSREGLTTDSKAGPVWNGSVRFNESWLHQPRKWKKPRMIFVAAHGDLFHPMVDSHWLDQIFAEMENCHWHTFQVLTKRSVRMRDYMSRYGSPPPNVWCGISAENQVWFDYRIADLMRTPAAKRFLSLEPLLGPIDAYPWLGTGVGKSKIDWAIVGAESGSGARHMSLAWAHTLRDQCAASGTAFFMKQISGAAGRAIKDIALFPRELQVREFPR